MPGIFVDIEDELSDIASEVDMLARGAQIYGNLRTGPKRH